jgi:hypothetical protein
MSTSAALQQRMTYRTRRRLVGIPSHRRDLLKIIRRQALRYVEELRLVGEGDDQLASDEPDRPAPPEPAR